LDIHDVGDKGKCVLRVLPKATNRYPGEDGDLEWYSMRMPMEIFIGAHAYLEISGLPGKRKEILVIQRSADVGLGLGSECNEYLSDAQLQRLIERSLKCKQDHRSCDGTDRRNQASRRPDIHLIDVRDRSIKPAG
jgi:hypothetical protein